LSRICADTKKPDEEQAFRNHIMSVMDLKRGQQMGTIQEFISIREQIESLAKEIPLLVERKTMPQPKVKLDEAAQLLVQLTSMVDNDVQVVAVGRLTRLLGTLRIKVEALESKRKTVKKPRSVAP
jgi:hypothetical protein